MKTAFQAAFIIVFLLIVTVWLGGLRLVVVPPASMLMYPTSAVVADGHTYRLVDSPQAMCGRLFDPAVDCEQVAIRKLARDALVKLPFNQWLYEFTEPLRPVRGALLGDIRLRTSM